MKRDRAYPLFFAFFLALIGMVACSKPDPLKQQYRALEESSRAEGLMRTERTPADVPFSQKDIIRDFQRIAFFSEYTIQKGHFVEDEKLNGLYKWSKPPVIVLHFGPSNSLLQTRSTRNEITKYTQLLSKIINQPILIREEEGFDIDNSLNVMIIDRAERHQLVRDLKENYPNTEAAILEGIEDPLEMTLCSALTWSQNENQNALSAGLIIIKSEHPPLMRRACIEEELAQALGLVNDSEQSRPSIFNDDDEFALLTKHDAILLRMLYDERLTPGMPLSKARLLLPDIAKDATQYINSLFEAEPALTL